MYIHFRADRSEVAVYVSDETKDIDSSSTLTSNPLLPVQKVTSHI